MYAVYYKLIFSALKDFILLRLQTQ